MPDDTVLRIGDKRKLQQTVYHDPAVAISAAVFTVYDAAGTPVVAETDATVDPESPESAEEHTLSYVLSTRGMDPGDYTWFVRYTTADEEVNLQGEFALFPLVTVFDRWARRIVSWWLDTDIIDQREISLRNARDAATSAVNEYSRANPRAVSEDVTMTTAFEYALPDEWVDGFSRIIALEYPVDDTSETKRLLQPDQFEVDRARNIWRFVRWSPDAGEVARVYYSAPYALRDATFALAAADTVPSSDFDAVARYAAGLALLMPANKSARTSQPNVGADLVNMRTKEQEFGARAKAMMELAKAAWPKSRSLAVEDVWL